MRSRIFVPRKKRKPLFPLIDANRRRGETRPHKSRDELVNGEQERHCGKQQFEPVLHFGQRGHPGGAQSRAARKVHCRRKTHGLAFLLRARCCSRGTYEASTGRRILEDHINNDRAYRTFLPDKPHATRQSCAALPKSRSPVRSQPKGLRFRSRRPAEQCRDDGPSGILSRTGRRCWFQWRDR